jgi:hypothetical protein
MEVHKAAAWISPINTSSPPPICNKIDVCRVLARIFSPWVMRIDLWMMHMRANVDESSNAR